MPPSRASRFALARAISASRPIRTSEVFSTTPVRFVSLQDLVGLLTGEPLVPT